MTSFAAPPSWFSIKWKGALVADAHLVTASGSFLPSYAAIHKIRDPVLNSYAMSMLVEAFVVVDNPNTFKDAIPAVFETSKCNGVDVFEISVDEIQHCFSIGSFSSHQYAAFCLEQIRKVGMPGYHMLMWFSRTVD